MLPPHFPHKNLTLAFVSSVPSLSSMFSRTSSLFCSLSFWLSSEALEISFWWFLRIFCSCSIKAVTCSSSRLFSDVTLWLADFESDTFSYCMKQSFLSSELKIPTTCRRSPQKEKTQKH